MNTAIMVDQFGYVRLVEPWGVGDSGIADYVDREVGGDSFIATDRDHEVGIIEAARQSTQGSFRGWEKDQQLLKFLFENRHSTPFEFSGMTIEVQAPIFVFREWHRHRTQSYNEMSARYEPLPALYYKPTLEDVMRRAHADTKNKQAKGLPGTNLTENNAQLWLDALEGTYLQLEQFYKWALEMGIPKELARASLPLGHYSRMRVTANLWNWLRFLLLRMDPNAQAEIRRYANQVGTIISEVFPRTWKLFQPVDTRTYE